MGRDDKEPHFDQALALTRAALAIMQARDLPEIMQIARTATRALSGADGVTLVLREGQLCRYADEDAIGPLWKGQRFPLTSCISGWVMLHDEAVIVDDIYADPRIPHEAYRPTFVQSLSMTPIRRGEPLGVIGCYWAHRSGADSEVLRVQQSLADAMAQAFEIMEMRRRLAVLQAQTEVDSREALSPLQDSETRYRLLVEQAPDGIFMTDGEGRCLEVNEAGARMFGYSREEMLSRSLADIVVPEEIPRLPLEISRVADGAIVTSEWCLLRKDGTTFPGEVVGRSLPDGRLQGILRDVSERRRAEAALRESESFNRQTLESIPGMVFTTQPDGHCNYVSQQWVDYTGVPMTDFLGDSWIAVVHPDDRERALDAWRNAVGDRAPYDLEYRVRRHDGVYELFHVMARHIRDELGRIVRWFGVATNIERLNRAEEQRIAVLGRQRDTLVREVHHRIKNNLQGVTGLLRRAMSDSPYIAEPLERAIAQIRVIAQVYGLQSRSHNTSLTIVELVETAAGSAANPVLIKSMPSASELPRIIVGDDTIATALVINELITNADKHRDVAHPIRPVRVALEIDAATVNIIILNEPARLPPGFDFAQGKGVGSGLELVAAMLPTRGAELVIRQHGEGVEARLTLRGPVIVSA